ncbi:MAG: choice-of-anchor X domain-containing protein [Pseudomonadota bacterium]
MVDAGVKGGRLSLVAWLERDGRIVVDGARMTGMLTAHRAATGDSEGQDRSGSSLRRQAPGAIALDRPMVKIDRMLLRPDIARQVEPQLLSRMATRKPVTLETGFIPKEMIGLELRDDGRGGDEVPFDGRYTAVIDLDGPRLYGAHIKAYLPTKFGPLTREALTSVLVR